MQRKAKTCQKDFMISFEDMSCNYNLLSVEFPESYNGQNCVAFVQSWLLKYVAHGTLSDAFQIDCAHRIPVKNITPGNIPRPILAKVLVSSNHNILKTIREIPDLACD